MRATLPLASKAAARRTFQSLGPSIKLTITGAPGCTGDKRPTLIAPSAATQDVFVDASMFYCTGTCNRMFLALAELKMDLADRARGLVLSRIGSLALKNVDMMRGSGTTSGFRKSGACLFLQHSPLTITGGLFSGCKSGTGGT